MPATTVVHLDTHRPVARDFVAELVDARRPVIVEPLTFAPPVEVVAFEEAREAARGHGRWTLRWRVVTWLICAALGAACWAWVARLAIERLV